MNHHLIQVIDGPTLWGKSTPTVVGAISASVLVEKGVIPHFDHSKDDSGYQRLPQMKRVRELAEALQRQEADLPTAILLSVRRSADDVVIKNNGRRVLDISQVDELYIVDGQHRFEALKMVLNDKDVEFPPSLKVPFVCMVGTSEEYEMKQFHIVNSTSRSVNTALSLELLRRRYNTDPLTRGGVDASKDGNWKVMAMDIVVHLFNHSKIWKDRICLANMEKGKTTIPATSFVNSLQPILKHNPTFRKAPLDKKAQILNAYWGGIQKVIPAAFESSKVKGENGYEKYTLQKGASVNVLHGIFNGAMDVVRSRGNSIYSSESYEDVLRDPILEIEAHNGHNELTSGEEFWLAGKNGCIANYSNQVGMNLLKRMLDELLPAPDDGEE